MIKYVCKPSLYKSSGMATFTTAVDAVAYLNKTLAAEEGDDHYVFIPPAKSDILGAVEDYQYIKKLEIVWDF